VTPPRFRLSTSDVEVTGVNTHGVWLFVKGSEYFLAHKDYPWFKEAKIADVFNVQLLHGSHLYWPALDVDLCLESLGDPAGFPLVYK
jgi:hypothetical protein